jgi:hypothetical protein
MDKNVRGTRIRVESKNSTAIRAYALTPVATVRIVKTME